MSSIQKRGDKWRVFVLVDGKRHSKTFRLKKEAMEWANTQEEDGVLEQHTFKDLIVKYRVVAATHKGWESETGKLNKIQEKATFLELPLEYLTKGMITAWRDARAMEVRANTVNRELIILNTMFNLAVNEWGWMRTNPASSVSPPKLPPPRRRGLAQDEIDAIVAALNAKLYGKPVAQMFLLSIETGMRLGEMTGLTWDRVREKFVILDVTKNGDQPSFLLQGDCGRFGGHALDPSVLPVIQTAYHVVELLANGLGAGVLLKPGQQVHQVALRGRSLVFDVGDTLFCAFGEFHVDLLV